MKITKEEFERFVIKTGPELGMKMGDFWYEFFTSSSDENNYTIHFNCNTPNILNEVKSKIEDNFKCTFLMIVDFLGLLIDLLKNSNTNIIYILKCIMVFQN